MEKPFIELGEIGIPPFYPIILTDYKDPPNFPNCCPSHKQIARLSEEFLKKFPNCCNEHRKIAERPDFNKADYQDHILKIVNRVAYTDHLIENKIEHENWYIEITNYIDYIITSFGSYGAGVHIYTSGLKNFIESRKAELGTIKAEKLIDYINSLHKSEEIIPKPIDLNVLYDTYQKWLKIFPFNISLFVELKTKLSQNLPILKEKPIYNPYTGLSKGKIITKKALIEFLVERTKQILQKIDSKKLLEEGHIKDTLQHRIDLINERHRVKQTSLIEDFSKGETRYLVIVKKWLKNEKEYFEEIPLLLNQHKPDGLNKRQQILIYCYEERPPLIRKHKDYNDYITFATPGKRMAYPNNSESKRKYLIQDIEKIIPYLTGNAKQQAEKELVTLISQH